MVSSSPSSGTTMMPLSKSPTISKKLYDTSVPFLSLAKPNGGTPTEGRPGGTLPITWNGWEPLR